MSKKGHSEEQIITVLQQAENGDKVAEVCRKLSISQATFYTWKKQYGDWASQNCESCGNCATRTAVSSDW